MINLETSLVVLNYQFGLAMHYIEEEIK